MNTLGALNTSYYVRIVFCIFPYIRSLSTNNQNVIDFRPNPRSTSQFDNDTMLRTPRNVILTPHVKEVKNMFWSCLHYNVTRQTNLQSSKKKIGYYAFPLIFAPLFFFWFIWKKWNHLWYTFLLFLGYGKCQFNLEYQGDYIVQVKNNLTDVVIHPETISIWGECHLKVPGGNVIIINRYRLPNRH